MSISEAQRNIEDKKENLLFLGFPWFYENIYTKIEDTIQEFFQRDYSFRFMGVSYDDENVLFFGDEYIINKFSINKSATVEIRICANLISSLLDNSLGLSESSFSISNLTNVEAILIKDFSQYVYDKLEELFIKTEPNKKILKKARKYNFTFYIQNEDKHIGKIIITIPDYVLNDNIEYEFRDNCFDISGFEHNTSALVTLRVGAARTSLNDIKHIENGDIIMLDDSNVEKMALWWEGNLVEFNITPNPALIISVDKSGDDEMDNNQTLNNENMWDTILVDVVAEFDNFKLTLGELKQISEGLVIDVGSVYNNKVKLRVAKQVVASGELVILNDRYGVRIDSVKNNDETDNEVEDDEDLDELEDNESENVQNSETITPEAKPSQRQRQPKQVQKNADGDENFNYSDFEIEDESI